MTIRTFHAEKLATAKYRVFEDPNLTFGTWKEAADHYEKHGDRRLLTVYAISRLEAKRKFEIILNQKIYWVPG